MPLRFEKITTHKKRFLDLLLLADEQESMIDRYLERGEMFVARDDGQGVAECVVTDEADGIGEIKNLAVHLRFNGKDTDDKRSNFWRRTTGVVTGRFSSAPGIFPAHSAFTNDADTSART